MLEFFVFSACVGSILYAQDKVSKGSVMSEKKKIKKIFDAEGFCVVERKPGAPPVKKTPKLVRTQKYDFGTEYVFRLPLGMTIHDLGSLDSLRAGLRKEIEIYDDGMLHLLTFNDPLPERVEDNFDTGFPSNMAKWEIPFGSTQNNVISLDFDKSSHMSVGGLTGYGKTYFIKMLITFLVLKNPDNVTFDLIDLKGGLSLNRFKNLKQVKSFADEPEDVLENLRVLKERIDERKEYFQRQGFENAKDAGINNRHFIIVDEAAELVPESRNDKTKMEIKSILEHVARVAGQLGFKLIYCTQYPTADVLPRHIKQNCDASLAFRVKTDIASQVILDEKGAEELPRVPGRAILNTDISQKFQVYLMTNERIEELLEPYKQEVKKDEPEYSEEATEGREYSYDIRPTEVP